MEPQAQTTDFDSRNKRAEMIFINKKFLFIKKKVEAVSVFFIEAVTLAL
jgi:hypothetical protein